MNRRRTISRALALLLALCMTLTVLPTTALAEEEGAFVPKRIFIEGSGERPDEELLQKASLVSQEFVAKGICEGLPIVYGDAAREKVGDLVVQIDPEPSGNLAGQDDSQSYHIDTAEGKVIVRAKTEISVMYGLRDVMKSILLEQPIAKKDQDMDVGQRIFHLDCGRKYFSREFIIALIRELSWLEMNQLELDFSNGSGFRFELDDMTLDINGVQQDISSLPGGDTDSTSWLTQEDMDAIIETAGQYGIEIVPCLGTPGHTGWIFGREELQKYGEDGEVDVEDETSTSFAKALVKKYAQYFLDRGCTTFHIGGDEYLHGYVSWLSKPASTEGKYLAVANYLDSLAGELKEMGYQKIRSFNDPLYYNNNTEYTWENVDEAEYWCYTGMNGFRYASPSYLGEKGLHMINGHGDFYDIMTDDNWQKPVGDAATKKTPAGIYAQFHNNTFAQGAQVEDAYIYGSTYFLWCDNAGGGTMEQVAYSLYPRLRAASAKMRDENASGSWLEFAATFTDSAGGFLAEGKLQDFQLPEEPQIKPAPADNMAFNGLRELVELMEGLDPGKYTAGSWEAAEAAIQAAKEVLENPDAAQKDIDKAMTALVEAFGKLEYGVQKLHLEIIVEEARTILENKDNYEEVTGLEEALESAQAVLAKENATQKEVDDAAYAVLDELFRIVEWSDASSLKSLVRSAKKLLDGNYTSSSLEYLSQAIVKAQAVLDDPNRSVEDVREAYETLAYAILRMEMKGNKAALKAILEQANEILEQADAYVPSTLQGLAETTAEAQQVYDNDDVSQSQVDEAVRTLTLKVTKVRLLGDVDGNGAVTTGDGAALLKYAAEREELDEDSLKSADVNGDGRVDTGDAVLILQYGAEKITAF